MSIDKSDGAGKVNYSNIGVTTISDLLHEIESDIKEDDNNNNKNNNSSQHSDINVNKVYDNTMKSHLCCMYESLPNTNKEFIATAVMSLLYFLFETKKRKDVCFV